MSLDPIVVIVRLLALIPALVIHEFSHGYSAWKLGDPTPKLQNRLSLNPVNHLDPMGTLMIIFAPIGWAKPVQVNPYNFRNPERDFMISTLCGPLSNIAQAIFWGLILRLTIVLGTRAGMDMRNSLLLAYLGMATGINLILAIFNLIPLGPLDGHRVLAYWLPGHHKTAYHSFNNQYGMPILFGLIMVGFVEPRLNIFGYVILLPAEYIGQLISGVPPLTLAYRIL